MNQDSEEPQETHDIQEPHETQTNTPIRVSNQVRKLPQMTPSTRKKRRADEKLDAAFEILTKASKAPLQNPNECQLFGNLVAKKLEKYNNVAQTAVQEAIMNILFAADRGYYDQYPPPIDFQSDNYSTPQNNQLTKSQYSAPPAAHLDSGSSN